MARAIVKEVSAVFTASPRPSRGFEDVNEFEKTSRPESMVADSMLMRRKRIISHALRPTRAAQAMLCQALEPRRLMSSASFNYTSFTAANQYAPPTGIQFTGDDTWSVTTGTGALWLDSGQPIEQRTDLYSTTVPIDNFSTGFSFQGIAAANSTDGFTFVLTDGSTADFGSNGDNLGYSGHLYGPSFGSNSVAVEFDLTNGGNSGSKVAFAQGGNLPTTSTTPGSLDFHSSDVFDAVISYDGGRLGLKLTDTTTQQTFNTSEAISLPSVLGADTAYVGFTGSTSANNPVLEQLDNWAFSGSTGPTFTAAATADPSPVTGTQTQLSAIAEDGGGTGSLSYDWSVLHGPAGTNPTFSVNNSASAATTIAHFKHDGTYRFRVTVTDGAGKTASSDVSVFVAQTPTSVRIRQHKVKFHALGTESYTGGVYDQFSHAMREQPALTFAVQQGDATIDPITGSFTAGSDPGHIVVSLSGDDLSGIVGATLLD